ncbi:MAG TPA: carboxypeptidase-like regulatory domain-containing protein, partial [Edaphobacter sp.]
MKLLRVFYLLVLSVIGGLSASAQIAAGLRGRVFDPSNAAVANARVELTQASTNLRQTTTTTSTSGDYMFTQLTPGLYRLDVTADGFQHLTHTGVTVTVGETVSANLVLSVGQDRQTVTVDADAPILQSGTSSIQTNIAGATVLAMPLNTRNFVQLTTLAPGVALPSGTLLPRINGGRPRTNEYLYDGISALQPEPGQVAYFPILDNIQEFTVETNNVPAEFGRFNGGVVNVATRSGSNAIHGSLFAFLRNEALNARNYFAAAPARKPEYRRNLYGATLGAPIIHDRLFFFGDYQGVKQLIGVTRFSTVPTLAERQGIFTGVSHIYNPATTTFTGGKYVRNQFPNDVINVPFDPAAKTLLARFPTPTYLTAAANNYTRTANDTDHQNQFDVRFDGNITSRDRAFGRYSYYHEVEEPVTPLP